MEVWIYWGVRSDRNVPMKARAREASFIQRANRASAVGRLMLDEFDSWGEFLKADVEDLESLPRRMLKSGKADVKKRLSKEIQQFCNKNFLQMDQNKLSSLFIKIKSNIGLEMPLEDFEREFAKINPKIIHGHPRHSTVVFSLWGLQFQFPEDHLAKDVIEALSLTRQATKALDKYKEFSHSTAKEKRDDISILERKKLFAARMCLLSCFNLVEAFINGLAWDFSQEPSKMALLSEKKKKLIRDVSIRDKLLKYPEIIVGRPLWKEHDEPLNSFLLHVKPFRDSLVHPSPFNAPEKFGGYDKLQYLYRIDSNKAEETASITKELIKKLIEHIYGQTTVKPAWFKSLDRAITKEDESVQGKTQ
jgi:hypothetical protein